MTRAIAIVLVTLLCGCSKHGQPSASGTAASSADTANQLPGTPPWSGHVLRGDDTEALRNYLRTVKEVKATVFQVQWNPATVAIDRETAIRSLRRVSRDGVTFVFAADEPSVQKLKPGSIMWVRNLALRKVDAVDAQGGLVTVRTSVVSLNEAMPNARIEFEAPVPVQNFLLSHREFPATATSPPTSSLPRQTYGFVPALYTLPAGASGASGNSGGTPPPGSAPGTGNAPGGGTPNAGSTPGGNSPIGGAANVGSATGGAAGNAAGSPNTGSAPGSNAGGGTPSAGSAPGGGGSNANGSPNAGSAPGGGASNPSGGGTPNTGSAPGGGGSNAAGSPNAGSAPGGGGSNAGGGGTPNTGSVPGGGGSNASGSPNAGSAPGGGGSNDGGGGTPNAGSAPGGGGSNGDGGAPNAGGAPGGGGSNTSGAPDGNAPNAGNAPGSGGDPEDQKDEQSFGDNAYSSSLNGMQYSIGYKPLPSGALAVALESRDGEDGGDSGGGKGFKHLFDTASDKVDVRFKVQAELSGFSAAGAYQIVSGNTAAAKLQFKNLKGHVTAAFVGRLGQPGNKGLKIPIMHLPITFNVPLPIEGIPFVVQLGGDFLLTVFLAGNHATLSVNGAYDFSGESGLTYTSAGLTDNSSFSGAQPAVTNYQGASLGVSAVMLAAQLPRIGFGLSVTGAASTIAFFDVVHVLTMTQAADAGAMMLTPRCKRITYNAVGHVGVETQILLLPIPAVQQWASDKLNGKREVFNQSKEVLDPPVKGCEVN